MFLCVFNFRNKRRREPLRRAPPLSHRIATFLPTCVSFNQIYVFLLIRWFQFPFVFSRTSTGIYSEWCPNWWSCTMHWGAGQRRGRGRCIHDAYLTRIWACFPFGLPVWRICEFGVFEVLPYSRIRAGFMVFHRFEPCTVYSTTLPPTRAILPAQFGSIVQVWVESTCWLPGMQADLSPDQDFSTNTTEAHQPQILTTTPVYSKWLASKIWIWDVFRSRILGVEAKPRLESRIKKFTPQCICISKEFLAV